MEHLISNQSQENETFLPGRDVHEPPVNLSHVIMSDICDDE